VSDQDSTEHTFGSTTSYVKWIKVRRPAGGQESGGSGASAPPISFWFGLPLWPVRRKPITLTLKYRGGAACWVEIHSRGRIGRYTGERTIVEILTDIAGGQI
jgi:hypothetical protein